MFEQIEKLMRDKNALYRYLVWIYRMKGCPGEALFFLKKLERNADTLCEEAILYRMRCDFKRARRKISSAISTFRKQNDKAGLSWGLKDTAGNRGKDISILRHRLNFPPADRRGVTLSADLGALHGSSENLTSH